MEGLRHLNGLDYGVVALYLLVVVGVGVYVARFNRTSGDYFKGGGRIPWGLSAASLFMSGFSAFMFVGAAGFTYRNGLAAVALFTLAFPAYLLGYYVYGRRWRRTRIDTPMQFLSRRFSPGTTYFYTLLSVVPNVLTLGISIYTLCIFIAAALGLSGTPVDLGLLTVTGFEAVLLVTGVVLVLYTLLGGLWAVVVTDAMQFLILFLITLLMMPVAYLYLGDGSLTAGVGRLVQEAPDDFFRFTQGDQPALFWGAYFINTVLGYNVNWHIAQRYYSVPDERDTQRMALWCAALSLVLPLLWILPVMASRVLFPDLAALWPGLTEPTEAAFVTLALTILPHGLLGVMVAAIFAATMSSADTTMNWLAAVLTKDVYVPLQRRVGRGQPSERMQLAVGKGSVAVLGVVAIWVAMQMGQYGGAFDVYLRANALYSPPMFIPVLLGLIYTRTPWWSGMVAFGAGVLGVIAASVGANLWVGLPVDTFGAVFQDLRVTLAGVEMGRYELNTLVGVLVSMGCFLASAWWYRPDAPQSASIVALACDLQTPAYAEGEALDLRSLQAYRLAAWLALGLGGGLLVMAWPTLGGDGARLNLYAGLLALALGGGVLWWIGRWRMPD